jgi:hypothetical protein
MGTKARRVFREDKARPNFVNDSQHLKNES